MQWMISRCSQICFKFCIEVGFHAKNEFLVNFLRFLECRCHGNHMLFLAPNRCIFIKEILIIAIFHTSFRDNVSFATLRWFCPSIILGFPFQKQQKL